MANATHDVDGDRDRPNGSSASDPEIGDSELLADLRRVGRETTTPLSEREYADRGRFGVSTFRRRFGSWNDAKERAGLQTRRPERIDESDLLADLRRVAAAVEGSLTERVYADRGQFGVTTFRRRFGSWNAAKRAAELTTEQPVSSTVAIGDDVARVAAEIDATYVTPEAYAERGNYPLSVLPREEPFWADLRERVGLAITPLYHKVAGDAAGDGVES
jgi:hypothetical protein